MGNLARRAGAMLAIAAAACGGGGDDGGDSSGGDGGGGGPGDPAAMAEVTERCGAFDVHATACGWGGNVNGYDWNCPEAGIVWRADAFRAFVQCAIDLACDGAGASCLLAANDAVEPIAAHQAYATACSARATECGLPALLCDAARYELYTDDFVQPITACFELGCGEILTCLERGG